jgi:hypothetical protein
MHRLVAFSFRAMFPATENLPGLEHDHSLDTVASIFRESSFTFKLGMALGGVVFMLCPLITVGIPLPAQWLSASALDRHTAKITAHPLYLVRQAMVIVKLGGGIAWGTQPNVRNKLALPTLAPDPGTWRAAHPGPTP